MDWNRAYQYRLDWFTSFVAVAESGGFSAAALTLYRSQPRISMQVAELERAIGFKVFDRSVHPVVLTPEGRVLLRRALALLDCVDGIAELAEGSGGAIQGQLRLGLYPSAATFLFPLLIDRLRQTHPALELLLWEGPTLSLDQALLDGAVDLAVRAVVPQPDTTRLGYEMLWREDLVAVLPDRDPRAGKPELPVGDLRDDPLIVVGSASGKTASNFEASLAMRRAGIDPKIAHRTNQPQTLIALVRRGLGIGVTNVLAMRVSNLDGVTLVPIDDPECRREVALWWRRDNTDSPARQLVRDAIISCTATAVEELGDSHIALLHPDHERSRV
jgi:DNA-binding transcriptional LysR family regulator